MGRLDNKVVVITGGARGQGAEEGRLFTAEGATVILADVLDEEGKRTAADLQGGQYMHLDVRSEQDVSIVAQTLTRFAGGTGDVGAVTGSIKENPSQLIFGSKSKTADEKAAPAKEKTAPKR